MTCAAIRKRITAETQRRRDAEVRRRISSEGAEDAERKDVLSLFLCQSIRL
jgi:hypothetical protein